MAHERARLGEGSDLLEIFGGPNILGSLLNLLTSSDHHRPIFGDRPAVAQQAAPAVTSAPTATPVTTQAAVPAPAQAPTVTPPAPSLSADEFDALQRMVTGADQPIAIQPTPQPTPQRTQPQRARRQATPAPAPMVAPVTPVAPAQAAAPIDAFTALQRMVSGADQPAPMASGEPAPVSEADTRYNQLLRMYNILEPTDQFTANQRAVQGTDGGGKINRDEALKYYGGDQEKFEILARLFGW